MKKIEPNLKELPAWCKRSMVLKLPVFYAFFLIKQADG